MSHCCIYPRLFCGEEKCFRIPGSYQSIWTVVLVAFKLFPRFCTLRVITCEKERNGEGRRSMVVWKKIMSIQFVRRVIHYSLMFFRVINPNLIINQQFGESRSSDESWYCDSPEVDLPRETKTNSNHFTPPRHVAEFSTSLTFPEVFYLIASYIRRFAGEIGPRMRGNPFVLEFSKTLGTSLEDQSLFRPIMTLLIATYRSFCAYKTSPKDFKHRYWYLLPVLL